MSVLIKKLYFDLFNLNNDLKNKNEIIKEYQILFDEYILSYKEDNKEFADIYNDIEQLNNNVLNDLIINQTNDNCLNDIIPDDEKNKSAIILKLYRNIVKITHPDKTIDLDLATQIKYVEYYRNATYFYNQNNLYELMYINKLLNYNPFIFEYISTDIDNLTAYKLILSNKIKDIETSFIWNFMHIDNEIELNNFIINHFKSLLNEN